MFVAGIDENGLAPKLGPMVVTGVLFETGGSRYDPAVFERAFSMPPEIKGARIADSKAVMSSSSMAAGEITVLAALSLMGISSRDSESLLRSLCRPPASGRKEECPAGAKSLCFTGARPLPMFGGTREEVAAATAALDSSMKSAGVRPAGVESEPVCPARFNSFFRERPAEGKADLDLECFERRMSSFSPVSDGEALFLCGKVMGLKFYSPKLSLIRRHPLLRLYETREESRYELQGLGEIRFTLDGDSIHGPISLASMVGKYVREIFMDSINRRLADFAVPGGPVSGYPDRRTSLLIRRAAPELGRHGVPHDCFLRDR